MKLALTRLVPDFETSSGDTVTVEYGPGGQRRRQQDAGAPKATDCHVDAAPGPNTRGLHHSTLFRSAAYWEAGWFGLVTARFVCRFGWANAFALFGFEVLEPAASEHVPPMPADAARQVSMLG